MYKKVALLFAVLAITFNLCGCIKPSPEETDKMPTNFLNSVWENEDGSCTINIVEEPEHPGYPLATGIIRTYSGDVPVLVGFSPFKVIDICPIEYINGDSIPYSAKLEHWDAKYKSEEEFIALVRETTYFNVGQRMVFHRIK